VNDDRTRPVDNFMGRPPPAYRSSRAFQTPFFTLVISMPKPLVLEYSH